MLENCSFWLGQMGNESRSLAKCVCQAALPLKKWSMFFQSLERKKEKTKQKRAVIHWDRHVLSISFNWFSFILTIMHLDLLPASKFSERHPQVALFCHTNYLHTAWQQKKKIQMVFSSWEIWIWINSATFGIFCTISGGAGIFRTDGWREEQECKHLLCKEQLKLWTFWWKNRVFWLFVWYRVERKNFW